MTQPVDQTSILKLVYTQRKPSTAGKLTDLCCIIGGAENQLGGSVVTGTDIRDVWLIFYQYLCASEITELQNASAGIQQKILWLDVAMADALGVDICEGTEELVDV
jgi:hypothetical protein